MRPWKNHGYTTNMPVIARLGLAVLMLSASACQRSGPGDAEVDACIQATERETTSEAPAGERAARIAAGCARMYSEPECREAHEKFGEGDPSQKARRLVDRCAHAYCDKLDAPKPSFCSNASAIGPLELAQSWNELRAAILKRDIGESRFKRLEEKTRLIAEKQRRAYE